MANPIPPEEYAKWLTPNEALTRISKIVLNWNSAQTALIRRIAAGFIRIHAKAGFVEIGGRRTKLPPYLDVPEQVIEAWAKSNSIPYFTLWESTDQETEVRTGHGIRDQGATYHLFGIRFQPDGVMEMLPSPPAPIPPSSPVTVESDPEQKGPRVSDALLKEWFAIFSKTYPDAAEAVAVQSARGMFPGKSVSRDRVRDLLGPRKRGPKPKGEAE